MSIPRILHFFWHDVADIPPPIQDAIETTQKTHDDFDVMMSSDETAKALMEDLFPPLAPLYERIRIPAARADVARMALLYKHGGVYIDGSKAMYKPFTDIFDFAKSHALLRRDDGAPYKNRPHAAHFVNSVLAAAPSTNFISDCIKRIHFNLASGIHNFHVPAATGPLIVTQAFRARRHLDDLPVYNFSQLSNSFFHSQRVAGVNNTWLEQQLDGIIDPAYYGHEGLSERVLAAYPLMKETPVARLKRLLQLKI
ncbi:MAG: glycosyltransferase [Pseudomonadota bacterium]